ncbi:hypothetical protein ACFSQ7_29800 [Paenibacillus rhizoplanae]
MPWNKENYPDSLKNFTAPVRNKAVEIANALLEDGYDEGRAIAIATAQAKEWGENHDKQIRKKRTTDNSVWTAVVRLISVHKQRGQAGIRLSSLYK